MQLSIIIVNWNSKDYLKDCIKSILNTTLNIKFEIIVIDSGSYDGCEEMLFKYYPEVQFFQSENNGFSKANNEAYRHAKGENILFLNPDTIVYPNSIKNLLHNLSQIPDAGIVGPKILNKDKTIQRTCIRVFPNIINEIFTADILIRIFPRSKLWGTAPLLNNSNDPISVDAVSGACMMIKRSVFENVGLFSEDYFMYSEDIDLCYKVKNINKKTYYIPNSSITHFGGGSSSKSNVSSFTEVMMLESRWRFFRKTRSLFYCRLYSISIFFISLVRISLIMIIWPIFKIKRKTNFAYNSLHKWISRLKWTIGLEKWSNSTGN